MDLDLDLEQIVTTFREEAAEGLASAEAALVDLERHPDDAEAVRTVFRVMHTIKGNAGSLDFAAAAELAHGLEDVLDRLRKGSAAVTPVIVTALLRSVDALRRLLAPGVTAPADLDGADRALVAELLQAVGGHGGAAPVPAAGLSPALGAVPAHQDGERAAATGAVSGERTLRVGISKLDRLLNLTGEIAIVQGRLRQTLAELGPAGGGALEIYGEADRLFGDLQEIVTQARMVPVGPVFRRFVRTVRDVAVAAGREAQLVVEGDDVEIDTSLVDAIRDPLTHMVRNAVDHGLEPPAARRAAGKAPCGTVTLRARREAGTIVIQVCDDGRGLDRERILARARALGIVDESVPAGFELDRLIFEPGVSTAETVTQVSGRGVGLDVVRRNVEALRGTVSVEGVPGRGTTITLRLPLTLAIIAGLKVSAGGETFVIPLDSVVECVALPESEAPGPDGHGVLDLRGLPLPFVRLRALFAADGRPGAREEVVVVRTAEGVAGFAVDQVLGESQTVIKPLGRAFRGLSGLSGAAILGNGRVALIVDVGSLLREELARAGAHSRVTGTRAMSGVEHEHR